MGTKFSFSPMFMTCCFFLLIILFTTTPQGFSARQLESISSFPNENVEAAKNQSKRKVYESYNSLTAVSVALNSTPTGMGQTSPPSSNYPEYSRNGSIFYSPPPPPADYPEYSVEAAKNQSKGEIHGSHSPHDGSTAGNSTPTGKVQLPPPISVTKVSYGTVSYSPPPPPPDYSNYP